MAANSTPGHADSSRLSREEFFMLRLTTYVAIVLYGAATAAFGATPCERLKSLSSKDVVVTAAELRNAGPYLPFGLPAEAASFAKLRLPEYCRVMLVLTPSSDSHIEVELWMPARAVWNGKYQAIGGGGWVGSFNLGG